MPTNPGIHAGIDLEQEGFPLDERRITYKLEKCFYVTRARKFSLGTANYRYLSLRPADNISHAIPGGREIILLFSDYDTFEVRTIDAFRRADRDFDEHRIDTSFRILISADKKTKDILLRLTQTDPDIPIILPLDYHDLLTNRDARSVVIDAVRESYHFRDLFAQRDPLKDGTYFFGRTALLNRIRDASRLGHNFGVFGLRKSGKTSLLLACQRNAENDGHLFLNFDCQSPSITTLSWNELLKHISLTLRQKAGISTGPAQLGDFSPQSATNSFEKAVADCYSARKKLIIISFDEIERISPGTGVGHWRGENHALLFWQAVRSVHQKISPRFSFIIAGTNPAMVEARTIDDSDNPLLEYVQTEYLAGLSESELFEMCNSLGKLMGLVFTHSAIAELYKLLGGHVFLSRQVGSQIHQDYINHDRPIEIDGESIISAMDDLNFNSLFDDIIGSLKERFENEYQLLEWIALGDNDEVKYFVENDPTFVKHLEGYGLVVMGSSGLKPRLRLLVEYLRSSASRSGTIRDNAVRWALIVKRRGLLELEIRKVLKGRLIDLYGKNDGKAILIEQLSKIRADAIKECSFNDIFSESSCKLYWSDFIPLVENDLEYWEKRFELPGKEILSTLRVVNFLRKDAHANEFSDNEFEMVMNGIDTLSSAL